MKRDISEARNPDLRNSLAVMKQAAKIARQTAIDTDTGIIVVHDGKPVRITAQPLRNVTE